MRELNMRRLAGILAMLALALAGVAVLGVTAAPAMAQARDLDCANFSTQAAAQKYFLSIGGPNYDPDRLDADGDGRACDSLPCPCGATSPTGPKPTPAPKPKPVTKTVVQQAIVIRVVDGDTVEVRLLGGGNATVRILGIDTPEVFGGAQCWGREASKFAKKKLPNGTRVTLTSDTTQDLKDRYGRILRYMVKKNTGTDFGKLQIKRGNATAYVFDKPFKRTKAYKAAQADAEAKAAGLWGACGGGSR